jgi:hypothetical protein
MTPNAGVLGQLFLCHQPAYLVDRPFVFSKRAVLQSYFGVMEVNQALANDS